MKNEKRSKLPLVLGAAAIGAYNFYKGNGMFNRIRFREQHKAASSYLEGHYPDAFYSDIAPTDDGWSCVVHNRKVRFVLYMTKSPDGVYLFWEKSL